MSPRPDVSQERRNQILDAASAVFARLGFHEARMDDIAGEAGLSKGALYWYFKSKDTIIAGLLERIFGFAMSGLRDLETAPGTVSERLLKHTRQLTANFERLQAISAVAFEFYAVAGRHRAVRQFIKGYFQTYRESLARLIQQGIERGEFRPVDADAVAVAVIAVYEGLGLLWFLDAASIRLGEQTTSAIELLLAGVRGQARED